MSSALAAVARRDLIEVIERFQVYQVMDLDENDPTTKTHRIYALKIVDLASGGADMRQSYLREIDLLRRLQTTDRVVKYYDQFGRR